MSVDKDMTISQIIQMNQDVIPILLDSGMHCIGCPSAQGETLEQACMVHGINVEELVGNINSFLSAE